jgi:hypothetical protein
MAKGKANSGATATHVPASIAAAKMVSLVSVSSPGLHVVKKESLISSSAEGREKHG